jgi:hypothetical protein
MASRTRLPDLTGAESREPPVPTGQARQKALTPRGRASHGHHPVHHGAGRRHRTTPAIEYVPDGPCRFSVLVIPDRRWNSAPRVVERPRSAESSRSGAREPAHLRWPTFLGQLRHPTGCAIQRAGDILDGPTGADELAGGFLGAHSEARGDLGGPVPFDDEVNSGLQSGELRVVEHQVNLDRCPVGEVSRKDDRVGQFRRSVAGVGRKACAPGRSRTSASQSLPTRVTLAV